MHKVGTGLSDSRDTRSPRDSNSQTRGNFKAPRRNRGSIGIVVATKDTFGFVQPFDSEDQIYFSEREAYRGIAVGDEISFSKRQTSRGFSAENVCRVDSASKKLIKNAKGVITRDVEHQRGAPGIIHITDAAFVQLLPHLNSGDQLFVPYFNSDVPAAAAVRQNVRLIKGDEVECTLLHINRDSPYLRAADVKLLRSKRDRLLGEQIQKMLDAGAVCEQGIIDTIKDDFGFIRPADHTDHIYFRIDDIVDQNAKIVAGLEVSYFSIVESAKGKMSDRAVHVQLLPAGTVKLERSLGTQLSGVVVVEPKFHPREEPGVLELTAPLTYRPVESSAQEVTVCRVELWPRCMPDGLLLKAGDTVIVDVQYYRPQKLLFGRSIKIKQFRKIGREYGAIVSAKDTGFGFIHSDIRDIDLYFRTGDVIDACTGSVLTEAGVVMESLVTFDVVAEEGQGQRGGHSTPGSSSSAPKLRAVRVCQEEVPTVTAQVVVAAQESEEAATTAGCASDANCTLNATAPVVSKRFSLMQSNMSGVVVRDSSKKDPIGMIKLTSARLSGEDGSPLAICNRPDIISALEEFRDSTVLQDITLDTLSGTQRKVYHTILDSHFPTIAHESTTSSTTSSNLRVIRVWKPATAEEFAEWRTTRDAVLAEAQVSKLLNQSPARKASNAASPTEDSDQLVYFQRSDVNSVFGLLAKDLTVTFDLWLDIRTGKPVAKKIVLTDVSVDEGETVFEGILESVLARQGKFGFMRCIPSDEKLFWNISGIASSSNRDGDSNRPEDYLEGSEVSYCIRKRGGMRCAVNIRLLPSNTLNREQLCDGTAVALVVNSQQVVLLDVSQCPQWTGKYLDLSLVQDAMQSSKVNCSSKKTLDQIWGKLPADAASSNLLDAAAVASEDTLPAPPASEQSCGEKEASSSDIKLFPILPRLVVPMRLSPDNTQALHPGDIVNCRILSNWGIQRHPIAVCDVTKVDSAACVVQAARKRGLIVKQKLRVSRRGQPHSQGQASGVAALMSRAGAGAGGDVEFSEICEQSLPSSSSSSSSSNRGDNAVTSFYCMSSEVSLSSEHSRDSVQQHDDVEFWSISPWNVAVCVATVPKLIIDSGIVFKRGASQSGHCRESVVQRPVGKFSGVTMAQGPPDDGSHIGFAAQWRPVPDVQELPWKNLLTHLIIPSPPVLTQPN